MAAVVWSVWGVFDDPVTPFESHVLAPEQWSEAQVVARAADAYEARGDEDSLETAQMLRTTGEAAPLLGIDGPRHRLEVAYDASAPYRLVIRESWADVELHLE
jgi:hypothetical protein